MGKLKINPLITINPLEEEGDTSKPSPYDKINEKLLGYGQAGLSMLAPMPSMIAGGVYGLSTLLSGAGLDKAVENLNKTQESNFGFGAYKPTTKSGQQSAESLQKLFAAPGEAAGEYVGAPLGKIFGNEELGRLSAQLPVDVAMNFLPLGAPYAALKGGAKAVNKALEKKPTPKSEVSSKLNIKPIETLETPVAPVVPDNLRLESPIAAENRIKALNMKERSADDWNSMEHAARAVDEEIAAMEQMQKQQAQDAIAAEQQRTHEFLRDAQQTVIDDHPYGDPGAQFGSTLEHGRIDENGIPIRADLSMEAQNLQNPLQRNLWGDELDQPTGDNGIPITAALDRMPPGPERDAAISQLSGQPSINKFGQGGAIDPKVVEDLYKFGKSIVRGLDNQLMPVYHGTTKEINGLFKTVKGFKDYRSSEPKIENGWIMPAERAYPGDLGTWFSSTPKGTDTFAGARTGVPGGNVHQAYLNLTKPKVFETHGDFIDWFHEKAADGRSANSIRRSLIKEGYDGIQIKDSMTDAGGARQDFVAFHPQQIESAISPTGMSNRSQRGAIDPDLLTLGIPKLISGVKRLVQKTPPVDSMATPINPETIAAKAEKRAKANAAKVDVYQSITTKQEALDPANLGKDLPPYVTQEATAGVGGVVRNHPNNGPLKYTRWALNDYTGSRDAFLKKYVTGKDAYNDTYKKLNPQEQADVYEMRKWMSDNQVDYSPELGQKAGLSEAAMKHMEARQKALSAAESEWGTMNLEKGLETFPHRMGYMASIFDRNYQALVGTMKDGVFKMDGFIGAKSLKEFRDALKHNEGKHIIKLGDNGRTGLRTQGQSKFRAMDDMAFLLNAMAEHDPKYADMKGALATAKAISNKGYMNFDVHEMRKAGVTGHQGNKPWVNKATNIKEALEAEITYLDQAANYIYGQKFLDRMADLQTDLRAVRPNTAKYLDKYVNHITGKSLEPTAAAVNQIVDVASKLTGKTGAAVGVKVPENPAGLLRSTGTVMNAMLMNIVNAGMFTAQTLQLPIAGLTESARIRAQYGMNPTDIATSMGRSFYMRGMLALLDHYGKLDQSNIPSHMKDAWHYLKEHGMDDFNEVMLSHDVLQSDAMTKTKQVAFWPTVVPEKITRPAMFLWMTDMFHRAGFDNKEALLRAKYATDFSMTDYRYEEAPLVYDRMGVLNPETSALQRYKHNAINQVISRTKESKEFPAAFLMATGLAVGFGGLLGLPAMNELDQMVIQPLTGKSAREHLEAALGSDNRLADGLASAYSHLDLGSRFSLADVAPNSFGEAVAGARLSKLYKMGVAAYEAGKNQDEASLRALGQEFVPSGLGQAYKEAMYTNDEKQLLNKKGQRMFDTPREGGLSMAAIMGARPLEEKRTSELNYARNKRLTDIQKKQADASKRMEMAINFRNEADFQKHLQTYKENFGDLKQIKPIIERAVKQGMMTETQRMQGVPGKTPLSIKRFLEFQE